jgi:hypothetical protein
MENDFEFEKKFWNNCTNTFDEEQKHYVYAKYMKIMQQGFAFVSEGQRILDIGGGPVSMLLKVKNLKEGLVWDPIDYPQWTKDRYAIKNIKVKVAPGEILDEKGWDEVWIYNCLQHTEDPTAILKRSLSSAKTLRIFEWVNIPPHEGHPQMITADFLDAALGQKGTVVRLAENGCYGEAYFNVVKQ